jgi:hypothetical protein
MATEGHVKFEYYSKGVPPYYGNGSMFPELLDDEKITVETPNIEMSYHQYFGLFKKFLMSVGFDEKNVMQGACNLAFNEMNREEVMRQVAEEYDLIMAEDLPGIIQDKIKEDLEWIEKHDKSWEKRYWDLHHRFCKLSHLTDSDIEKIANDTMKPYGHSDMEALRYSDEELNAMCDKAASDEEKEQCREYNLREAEYYNQRAELDAKYKSWNGLVPGSSEAVAAGCSCPVMDNEEMPDDRKWVNGDCPIHGKE